MGLNDAASSSWQPEVTAEREEIESRVNAYLGNTPAGEVEALIEEILGTPARAARLDTDSVSAVGSPPPGLDIEGQVIDWLWRRHGRDLIRWGMAVGLSHEDAEDITSDALAHVLGAWRAAQAAGTVASAKNLPGLLRRIVERRAVDSLRRQGASIGVRAALTTLVTIRAHRSEPDDDALATTVVFDGLARLAQFNPQADAAFRIWFDAGASSLAYDLAATLLRVSSRTIRRRVALAQVFLQSYLSRHDPTWAAMARRLSASTIQPGNTPGTIPVKATPVVGQAASKPGQ